MQHTVLFRTTQDTQQEFYTAASHIPATQSRIGLKDQIVIGRYSVLPYYKELERDLGMLGSRLINSYNQHLYIANFDYYEDVKEFTPKTYFVPMELPDQGPFIVKGRTNSRKHKWNTHMFAKTKKEAMLIALDLLEDPLIAEQGVLFREYVPLKLLEIGINDQPFVNEWRFFYYKEQCVAHGFYWIQSEQRGQMTPEGLQFADRIAKLIAPNVNFFVLDIAETKQGEWILIEVNDGQMSGLSECDPDTLYRNLNALLVTGY